MRAIVDSSPARRLAKDLVEFLNCVPDAHIAVSGGSTPRALFRILAAEYRGAVRWDRVTIWQVDERCVPPDDPQSNWRMLAEELLSQIPDLKSNRMEAERDGAADDYESLIRRHVREAAQRASQTTRNAGGAEQIEVRPMLSIPQLDLILLGMGADGHTASLFPGTAALEERERLVVRNAVPQLNTTRVTMTFPLINAARERWFLASGADKANAFKCVQTGELPSAKVCDPVWYVDSAVVGA